MTPQASDAEQFPSTAWSLVAGLRAGDTARGRSLAALARGYWTPICSYLRRALRRDPADAEDLTQAFLAWLLEDDVLGRYDSQRGPFRSYLKGLLRHFVLNQARRANAQKRGGNVASVPLASLPADALADPQGVTPEDAFDRAWIQCLLARATERLERALSESGRAEAFAIFAAYDMPPPVVSPTYLSVAEQLGVSENTVRHQLYKVRELLRRELRAELRDTVLDARQLEEEWRGLFL